MLLHINGSTKKVRKIVEQAAWYYAEKLMGKRLINNLELNINLKKGLRTRSRSCSRESTLVSRSSDLVSWMLH